MRCVVQRVCRAAVTIRETGDRREIGPGLALLLGVHIDDSESDADYLAEKVATLRIFPDAAGKMNRSVVDIGCEGASSADGSPQIGGRGSCLVVSQFTLVGDARKGRRPSFIDAARPEKAIPLYLRFVDALRRVGLTVATGEFGADMMVEIENDGPVTILLDSAKLF